MKKIKMISSELVSILSFSVIIWGYYYRVGFTKEDFIRDIEEGIIIFCIIPIIFCIVQIIRKLKKSSRKSLE